jgi:hypothetical protein
MPGMKWSTRFAVVLSASIGIRTGAPKPGFRFAAVGAGMTLIAMSFGVDATLPTRKLRVCHVR